MTQPKVVLPPLDSYTLTQLQAMTSEDFIRYFPQPNSHWKNKGYLVNAKGLMEAIIYAIAKIHWPKDDERGPREVWYFPTKSIVMRAVGLRANKYDGAFEKLLSTIVKSGNLRYEDLGIKDFRSLREICEEIDNAECWENILLFVEKDSAYIHLKSLKAFLNINIMSGGGWSNTSGIEAQLNLMSDRGITEIEIFTMTDYDPFGFAIDREFVDKCGMLGFTVTFHKRIGIGIEHTTPEILDIQKYPIKPGKKLTVNGISFDSDKWLAEYGIDGKYGIEIEAVSGQIGGHQKLREIVAEELLKHLEEKDRIDELLEDIWENVDQGVLEYYLDSDTLEDWNARGSVRDLDEYITPEEYETRSAQLKKECEDATEEDEQELFVVTEELAQNRNSWDNFIADEYAGYEEKIKELRKKYILPLQEARDSSISAIRDNMDEALYPLESKSEYLEGIISDLEGPYNSQLSYIKEEYEKSRALFAEAVWDWLKENCGYYYDLGRTVEDLSFGLMRGCLMKSVKNGETIKEMISRVASFDSWRAYGYISSDIETDKNIQWQINENLVALIIKAMRGEA